jgi:oxygen-independent coproporphyrinogen-3 oxidase
VKHPSNYAQLLVEGSIPSVDIELLTETQQLEERAMLGLRLREGLDLDVVKKLNPQSARPVSEMVAEELIDGRAALQGRVVLTLKGRLLADLVLRKILGL